MIDEKLLEFCGTDKQRERVQAYIDCGGRADEAAKRAGCDGGTMRRLIRLMKARAAKQGYSPEHDMTHPVPDGFKLKGQSTLYDDSGKQRLQWVKTTADHERQLEIMREVVAEMKADIPALAPAPPSVPQENDDLLNAYIITDYHLGMMAWHEETRGDDWDLKTGEALLLGWFRNAIELAPDCKTAVFAQLGDYLHWDGMEAVTPTHKHLLDADTRFQKLVRTAIRVLRQVVTMLLAKHEHVHIIMADANHDPASETWLREMFHALYDQEPRVTVDVSADTYYCYEHGDTSLFFHHGHKRKPENIDDVFASKFREVFGRTRHSYAHMGHQHHVNVRETNLMLVEQHRTLAAADAHASRLGYHAGREASVITYHRKHGQVGRLTITPEMVYDREAS